MSDETVEKRAKEEKEMLICPCCLGEKIWPFADVAYGMTCPICAGAGKVDSELAKLAIEQGW